MSEKFVYVTYIRTTAEKLWAALTKPEFTRKFWFGTVHECEWQTGSPWRLMTPDGRVADSGGGVRCAVLASVAAAPGGAFCAGAGPATASAARITAARSQAGNLMGRFSTCAAERADSHPEKPANARRPPVVTAKRFLFILRPDFIQAATKCTGRIPTIERRHQAGLRS